MKLLVSALEPSSNKYLQEVINNLQNLQIIGIGDIKNSLYPLEEFSVMGLLSVLPKIRFFKKVIKDMIDLSSSCDGVLLLDAPSFNLRLAQGIKKRHPNKTIFYYILPKVWAWKSSRLALVEKYTDYQISILPFENKIYSNSVYFGNPLLDEYREENIDFSKNNYIAFLPGSRKSEIVSLMPIFKELVKKIHLTDKDKKPLLVIPKSFSKTYIASLYGDISDFKIISNTKEALSISSFAFVCSGTATFEASLLGIPFVLCYDIKGIDLIIYYVFFKILKHKGLGKIGYIGLANIISHFNNKQQIHKEITPSVTIDNLTDSYSNFNYKKHFLNINTLRTIMNPKNTTTQNSTKQVSNFIYTKMQINGA